MKVTLSFDNGPEPEITHRVLDVLERRAIRTTFFVLGKKLQTAEERRAVRRAHALGHWIGNHSFSHEGPLGLRDEAAGVDHEIGKTQQLIGDLAHADRLFRPFGGGELGAQLLNRTSLRYLVAHRYSCVLWHSAPGDWHDPVAWPERALADCRMRAWTAVVLHDVAIGALPKLEDFLDGLAGEGGSVVQPFPDDCMPIIRGEIVRPDILSRIGIPAEAIESGASR